MLPADVVDFFQVAEQEGDAVDLQVLVDGVEGARRDRAALELADADLAHHALVVAHDAARVEAQLDPPVGASWRSPCRQPAWSASNWCRRGTGSRS